MKILFAILKVCIIAVIVIIGLTIFFSSEEKKQDKADEIALDELNLKLKGIIESVDYANKGLGSYHGFGIIRLRIITSNITNYSPPAHQDYYYCRIRNAKAELYDHVYGLSEGDTINVDTRLRKSILNTKQGRHEEDEIKINATPDYYFYIKNHTEL